MHRSSPPTPIEEGSRAVDPRRASDPFGSSDDYIVDSGRFVPERMLGTGSMGAVHLVRDRETGDLLALKKLFKMDAKSVLRLKREFRSLANMSHPNLVKLYELGRGEDGWFIVMEYIQGQELWSYVGLDASDTLHSGVRANGGLLSQEERIEQRVLPAFYQLAQGVHALHQARMLHRDLKPSNVLVAGGRVVVLDFGLVRDLDADAASVTEEGVISGTPAYMAPEQALAKPLSEASDWYAFGAMLYEALTNVLPFDGAVYQLIRSKLEEDPKPPSLLAPNIPARLGALCMSLLARDPKHRPDGTAVLAQLESWTRSSQAPACLTPLLPPSTVTDLDTQAEDPIMFAGRQAELAALDRALDRVSEHNAAVVVHVRGASGSGKSGLIEHFLDQVETFSRPADGLAPLVLRSRCYEREAMPFKALDGVVDALARDLTHMDDVEVSHFLPTHIEMLAQVFPVLQRLRAVQRLISTRPPDGDALRNRQRAEVALRELFRRLAARRPVVVWIDDLQWGDMDSASILRSWIEDGAELPLLLLLSYRSDETETSECLKLLCDTEGPVDGDAVETVDVGPLPAGAVRTMFEQRLAPRGGHHGGLIESMVREAQGSPFLAIQLLALAEEKLKRGDADVDRLSLGDLLAQIRELLPHEAIRLLSVLSVAGRPLAPKVAFAAAGIRSGGRDIIHTMQRLHLVRTRNVSGTRLMEIYHNGVRRGVQEDMHPDSSRQLHAILLGALEADGEADPEWLHSLALSAEDRGAALRYGLLAAERAQSTLAFERAAELYRRCLDLMREDAGERKELYLKLAGALSACGRGAQAAEAYLEASRRASGKDAVRYLRLSASHQLRIGRFEEGEATLDEVLSEMGLSVPRTPAGLKAAILWERMRLRMRGMAFSPREEADVAPAVLEQIDTYNAMRAELGSSDPLRGALFLMRQLHMALDAGEPLRVLQGLFGVCYMQAADGSPRAEALADQLMQQIDAISDKLGTPVAQMHSHGVRALASYLLGRFEAVTAHAEIVEQLYHESTGDKLEGYYFLRLAVLASHIGALYELSDYSGSSALLQSVVREAERTDNRAALLQLSLSRTLDDGARARVEASVARLIAERDHLPGVGFGHYHALHMISACQAAAASGRHAWGLAVLESDWPRFVRSPVHRVCMIAFLAQAARVQLLLNHALTQRSSGELSLAPLRREVRALRETYLKRRGVPLALVQEARLAYAEGDSERAIDLLERSIEACICPGETLRARYALGVIVGGERGEAQRTQATSFLAARGVADPIGYLRGHLPELVPSD